MNLQITFKEEEAFFSNSFGSFKKKKLEWLHQRNIYHITKYFHQVIYHTDLNGTVEQTFFKSPNNNLCWELNDYFMSANFSIRFLLRVYQINVRFVKFRAKCIIVYLSCSINHSKHSCKLCFAIPHFFVFVSNAVYVVCCGNVNNLRLVFNGYCPGVVDIRLLAAYVFSSWAISSKFQASWEVVG